jgi:hypothetical protein
MGDKFMKYIKTYGYAVYLGIACAICGITVDDWRFWIIYLPTVILVIWKSDAKEENK